MSLLGALGHTHTMTETRRELGNVTNRWVALVVLCVGMLMIVLDATVVNVALPSIQDDLGFSQSSLAWVVNAYLIAFGGLLLLAGRIGDLISRRGMFLAGLGEPARELAVDDGRLRQAQAVHVVVRRDVLHAREALALQRTREHEVGEQERPARLVDPGEPEAHLQRHA